MSLWYRQFNQIINYAPGSQSVRNALLLYCIICFTKYLQDHYLIQPVLQLREVNRQTVLSHCTKAESQEQ